MMKLSTMEKFYATVDDQWRSELAEKILSRWEYDLGSVYAFRASSNFVFIFKKEGRQYFLRFNHSCERDLKTIETEIDILLYLQKQLLQVAHPVKSTNNKYVETIETEIGTFYAVVFEKLPGLHYGIEELNKEQFIEWGSALGKLHRVLKGMPVKSSQKRESWRDQLSNSLDALPDYETSAIKEIKLVIEWAEGLSVSRENFGLVHYDFELDNLIWSNKMISILDFDDCSNNWFVADIAYALRDLFEDQIDMENPLFKEFMVGYTKETEVDTALLQQMPWFMRMHNIVSYTDLLRSVDICESPNRPDWLNGLRKSLLNERDRLRASFK